MSPISLNYTVYTGNKSTNKSTQNTLSTKKIYEIHIEGVMRKGESEKAVKLFKEIMDRTRK